MSEGQWCQRDSGVGGTAPSEGQQCRMDCLFRGTGWEAGRLRAAAVSTAECAGVGGCSRQGPPPDRHATRTARTPG